MNKLFLVIHYYIIVMHLGHSISSGDRTEIVRYAKSSFNIFRADFGHISSQLKNVLFQKYCCVFYGSPLWPLECAMIQSLCVDWRKALRCVWSVNNITHCDIITSLSNQFPHILRLKKRFIKLISNCLVSQNNIVKIISQVAICNPMSNTGSNYRCTSDSDGKLSIKSNMNDWHIISDNVCTKIDVLHDLINIREGNISCDGFTREEINFMIYDICVH